MTITQKCDICQKDSKYKCTICRFPFCSVACGNEHRNSPACVPETTNAETPSRTEPITSLTTSQDEKRLEALLRDSSKLKEMFKSRKLREMILAIDSSPNAAAALDAAMTDPDFQEFVQETLEVTAEPDNT